MEYLYSNTARRYGYKFALNKLYRRTSYILLLFIEINTFKCVIIITFLVTVVLTKPNTESKNVGIKSMWHTYSIIHILVHIYMCTVMIFKTNKNETRSRDFGSLV